MDPFTILELLGDIAAVIRTFRAAYKYLNDTLVQETFNVSAQQPTAIATMSEPKVSYSE